MKRAFIVCAATAAAIAVASVATGRAADRPPVIGRNAGASAGHPLTTAAAIEILHRGGNAFDAGVAALLVGGVVEQDLYSLGGEALVLVYPRTTRKVVSVVGQGWAPKGATLDSYVAQGKTLDGAGLNPSVVPGALHAALTVLERWGTMSFEQVSARAIAYAADGFPLRPLTAQAIRGNLEFFKSWPHNQRYWLEPDGSPYVAGDTVGSFWPHDAGFNKLNVEVTVPDAVMQELKRRGHDVGPLPPYGMSGCATAVILDPATGNRIAGADPRRDCYAMAY